MLRQIVLRKTNIDMLYSKVNLNSDILLQVTHALTYHRDLNYYGKRRFGCSSLGHCFSYAEPLFTNR